jgi:hypothetical protein
MFKKEDIEAINKAQEKLKKLVFSILFEARVIATKKEDQYNNFVAFTVSETLSLLKTATGVKENPTFIDRGMNTKEETKKALEALVKIGEFDHKKEKCKITKMSWNGEIYYTCEFI